MCVSCSRISQQKKPITQHCVSFVDHFIAAFCCSLWTSCRQMGSQSSCAFNHCKLVIRPYALLWKGTGEAWAIPLSFSKLSLQYGNVTVLPSPSLPHPLKNFSFRMQLQNCLLSFSCMYTPFTSYARLLLTLPGFHVGGGGGSYPPKQLSFPHWKLMCPHSFYFNGQKKTLQKRRTLTIYTLYLL